MESRCLRGERDGLRGGGGGALRTTGLRVCTLSFALMADFLKSLKIPIQVSVAGGNELSSQFGPFCSVFPCVTQGSKFQKHAALAN